MQQTSRQTATEIVSPFEWQRYCAQDDAKTQPRKRRRHTRAPRAVQAPLTAAGRAAQVLAQRWGNPYCRPGWP